MEERLAETLAEDVFLDVDRLDVIMPDLSAADFKRGKMVPVAPDGYSEWLMGPQSAVATANADSSIEVRYRGAHHHA